MNNYEQHLILTIVDALESTARLEFGDESKYVRYATQIRDLLTPIKQASKDNLTIFDDCMDNVLTKTAMHTNSAQIDTDKHHIHCASQLMNEIFNAHQQRVIAQRIINNSLLAKTDGYCILSKNEKRLINIAKSQIKRGLLKMKNENEICTSDELAEIDLHFECTKIPRKRAGFTFNPSEHTFIAEYIKPHIDNRNHMWQSLTQNERNAISAKMSLIKIRKLKSIDLRTIDAEKLCDFFDLDWNRIKGGDNE